jgi:hypothetical protein
MSLASSSKLQPDARWIFNPGGSGSDALVFAGVELSHSCGGRCARRKEYLIHATSRPRFDFTERHLIRQKCRVGRQQGEQQRTVPLDTQLQQPILPTARAVGFRRADALPLSELRRIRITSSQRFSCLIMHNLRK